MRRIAWMTQAAGLGALLFTGNAAVCQETAKEQAALADALRAKHVALHTGLKNAASKGTPISGKYELEGGKLQLSVYTEKGGQFMEVIVDHRTGKVVKSEKITDAEDLKAATAQSQAMAKANGALASALTKALAAHPGHGAVSATAALKDGKPVAEITLLKGTAFTTITEPL